MRLISNLIKFVFIVSISSTIYANCEDLLDPSDCYYYVECEWDDEEGCYNANGDDDGWYSVANGSFSIKGS